MKIQRGTPGLTVSNSPRSLPRGGKTEALEWSHHVAPADSAWQRRWSVFGLVTLLVQVFGRCVTDPHVYCLYCCSTLGLDAYAHTVCFHTALSVRPRIADRERDTHR